MNPVITVKGKHIANWLIGQVRIETQNEKEMLRYADESRESETRYHSLFDNILQGFAYCRIIIEQGKPQDFVYLNVNKAFETLTGLKDVVGKRRNDVAQGIKMS